MSANTFGHFFKVTSFGESHGEALGVVIDGCPAGVEFDLELLRANLQKRRPGQSAVTSARAENDEPEIVSGVYSNLTLGTPICILVRNQDQRPQDYDKIRSQPRIGHADDTWLNKFGHVDHRGGGRSSGRETLARVLAGSVAQMLCRKICPDAKVKVYASQIAEFALSEAEKDELWNLNIEDFPSRFPSAAKSDQVTALLKSARDNGESYGGTVEVQIRNLPAGLGQPVFHKFKADLASAVMSIGATSGFELGEGLAAVKSKGTDFHQDMNSVSYGGVRGGITTGETVLFRTAFKPTSSIKDVAKAGRHDPCIVPRAVPVVESMTWLVIADHLLWSRVDRV